MKLALILLSLYSISGFCDEIINYTVDRNSPNPGTPTSTSVINTAKLTANSTIQLNLNFAGSQPACFSITNSSSKVFFIPYRTKTEWDAFYANKPSPPITIASCTATPPANGLGCTAQTINGCILGGAANGITTSGSCPAAGACSYNCNGSAWQLVDNSCVPCSASADSQACCAPGKACTSSSPAIDSCGCINGDDFTWKCVGGLTKLIDLHTQNCH